MINEHDLVFTDSKIKYPNFTVWESQLFTNVYTGEKFFIRKMYQHPGLRRPMSSPPEPWLITYIVCNRKSIPTNTLEALHENTPSNSSRLDTACEMLIRYLISP